MVITNNIDVVRGDGKSWTGVVRKGPNVSDEIYDLTNCKLRFTVKRSFVDKALFQKTSAEGGGIVISLTPTDGKFTLTLSPSDTKLFPQQNVKYVYDLQVIGQDGVPKTADRGTITIYPEATES